MGAVFPFSFSLSVSFGTNQLLPLSPEIARQPVQEYAQDLVTYIPQMVVLGAFVVLLLAHVAGHFAHVVRSRRRRRQARVWRA
jgi:hypothetical protein